MVAIKEASFDATHLKVLTVENLLDQLGGFSWFQLWAAVITICPEIPAAMVSLSPVLTGSHQFCDNTSSPFYTVDGCEKTESFPGVLKSVVQEWDLTGSNAWISDLFTSFQMFGALFGALVAGQLAEKYGRRCAHFSLCFCMGIFGFASGWAPDPYTFCVFRFFAGFAVGGCYVVYLNYLMEFLTPTFRTVCGCVSLWSLGEMLLALIGYLLPGWRQVLWATSLPVFLVFFAYPWMPESPRWLLCHGRTKEAIRVFDQIARWNGRPCLDPADIIALQKSILQQQENSNRSSSSSDDYGNKASNDDALNKGETSSQTTTISCNSAITGSNKSDNENNNIFHKEEKKTSMSSSICNSFKIFSYREYRFQLFTLMFAWFASQLIYYGISFNMKHLSGDPYLNVLYMGAVGLPGSFTGLLFNNRLGRRTTIIGFATISFCLILALIAVEETNISENYPSSVLLLCLSVRLFVAAGFAVLSCFTAESFPTVVRVSCMGICALFGNVGGILAPQFVFISTIVKSAQYITFGLLSLATMICAFSLREMTGKPLEDYLQQDTVKPQVVEVVVDSSGRDWRRDSRSGMDRKLSVVLG